MNIFHFFPQVSQNQQKMACGPKLRTKFLSLVLIEQCNSVKRNYQIKSQTAKAACISSRLYKTGGGEGSGEELNSIDQVLVNKMPKVSYMVY